MEQHTWRGRESQRGADGVFDTDGRRHKTAERYQLAVDEAKVRLNLAVCPGAWLMPARMIINTESIVGYNNKLMQGKAGMKLGVNNDVNVGTKKRHCS